MTGLGWVGPAFFARARCIYMHFLLAINACGYMQGAWRGARYAALNGKESNMSHTFKSAAAFYAAANGKRVRKVVSGVATAADWPAMTANIRAQLLAQGCAETDILEDADCLRIKSTGQFWMRPKVVADECGVLTVRSADYSFLPECGRTNGKGIFGDKKGAAIEGASLVKRYDNGMIVTLTIEAAA